MTILLTGGAGYIGRHVYYELVRSGFDPIVVDDLSNASLSNIAKMSLVDGKAVRYENLCISNKKYIFDLIKDYQITAVIHLAGSKYQADSIKIPFRYFQNNVHNTLDFFDGINSAGCKKIIFSSSAAVYGDADKCSDERDSCFELTPYAASKLMIEISMRSLSLYAGWQAIILRYFNPIGRDEIEVEPIYDLNSSGLSIEDAVTRVLDSSTDVFEVYGLDHDTRDGSCIRDYIHVSDIATGHVMGLKRLINGTDSFTDVINLGSGRGTTVLEFLDEVRRVTGHGIPVRILPRRPGEISVSLANIERAKNILNWTPQHSLGSCCESAFRIWCAR